jgi:hypothetical protein
VVRQGELPKSVVVEMVVEFRLQGGEGRSLDHHVTGGGHLEVAGTGGDVQVEQGAVETRGSGR